MKLHLPILLRRAVLAVMAALTVSPAVAHEYEYYDEYTMEEDDSYIHSDYKSDETYFKRETIKQGFLGIGAVYRYHYHGDSLIMKGAVTNRIESGLFGGSWVDSTGNITVKANKDVKMMTANGVNIIAGNAAEINEGLASLINAKKDALGSLSFLAPTIIDAIPDNNRRPTVTAGGDVLMNGPGNAVMLGSIVSGQNVTLTNTGTGITSAATVIDSLLKGLPEILGYNTKNAIDPILVDFLAPLQDIKGNFNIVQGSTIGNANTVNVTMHADVAGKTIPIGTSALGANIVLGGSTITAQNVDLTGMASVITNIPLKDAFNELSSSMTSESSKTSESSMLDTVSNLLDTGKATKIEATTGNVDLDTQYNVLLGCGTDATQALTVSAANGAVNMTGALNVVAGNTIVTAENINMTPNKTTSIKDLSDDLKGLIDISNLTDGALKGIANQKISAAIVAGGAELTAKDNITLDGTLGLVMNTPVADVIKEFNPLSSTKNPSELEIVQSLLQKGTATKLTSEDGSINVGSQFNLLHGGNMADADAALTLTANKGAVNVQGTANVVSGNVVVNAQNINMTGEVLPGDLAEMAGGLVSGLTKDMGISGVAGVVDKLVQKGSVNMVTGGATLNAAGDITMTAKSVDDVGKIGAVNAVIDTEMVDVLEAYINKTPDSLVQGGGYMTTLKADGNINLLGRVNVVNGTYVKLDAGKEVNMQGNISMIGGAKVNADSININTSDEAKYKMYLDAAELGGLLPEGTGISEVGINAAVITGGAELTAKNNITIDGTAGILLNTPIAEAGDQLMDLLTGSGQLDVPGMANELLQKGTATTITSEEGSINLGSQLNLAHGGGFTADGANALTFTAKNGAVNMQGTANVISGNVEVDAKGINMMGERLPSDMAALGGIVGDVAGGLVDSIPGIGGMVDKLVQKGSVNVVTGGATLEAGADGITMSDIPVDDVGATGAINAVLDTDLAGVLGAMTGDNMMDGVKNALMAGGSHQTTLKSEGNINMLGRVNVVNGGKVVLDAKGDVNLQGSASLISGGATVTAQNININTDEAKKYKMYFDATELGGLAPEGSPFAPIVNSISGMGLNAAVVTGGADLTATGNINMGGTLGLVMNTPISEVLARLGSTNELWEAMELMNTGVATNLTSTNGNINLGSQLNLVHGGNFTEDGANVLTLTANKGVNVQGSVNVVSGNTQVNANKITLTGERLPADMAGAAGSVVGSVAGMLPGAAGSIAGGMLDKLVQKGAANIVTGGATLTAGAEGITMSGVHETGAINAVLDTEIPGLLRAFMEGNNQYVVDGGSHRTTLKSAGNIDMLGRVNVVNGGKVVLEAQGDVSLQGNASLISGGATVKAQNININTDESEDYKIYFDSTELGGLVPATSPFAPIVNSVSGIGLNAGIVAGGAKLTAQDSIKIGGTLGLVMNTPLSAVMTQFSDYLGHQQETYMLYKLLQPGVATTVKAENGNIEVEAQFNLLHGGGFTANAGENALVVSADNGAVNVDGTFNVISGNTQVTAQEINMTGEILPADMAGAANGVVDGVVDSFIGELPGAADNLLDRLVAKGNGNIVTGGATLTATGEKGITMSGAANAVIDTELVDVIDAFMQRDTKPLEDGGNHLTTLTSAGNIEMLGRLNVVNGAYVKLDAAQDVNLKGTLNVVSGKATVEGNNINLVGQQNLGLDWDSLLPGDVGNYMDQMGITNKLDKGVNGNLVLGGAKLNAENNITISGMASVVTNTPVGSVFEALNKKLDNDWYPELWLAKEVLDAGIATTLNAENGSIIMDSRLNVLHGGMIGDAAAALALTAGKDVKLDGTLNMVSGNVTVDAQNIELKGGKNIGLDLSLVVDKALGAEYTELAKESGMIDKIANKGLNANVVMGGATLTATNDITMDGMANAVLDTELTDVVDFVEKGGDPSSLVEGGSHKTTLTATNGNINMLGRLNVVNGGQVELKAGQTVKLEGTANLISGNAKVSGKDIELNGKNNVGLNWGELIPDKYAGYTELAKEMGILDKANGGVNGNVVAGGAKLTAENDISINGMAGAVVDTTLGSVMEALQNMIGTPLLEGETKDTTLTAGGNINMNTRLNIVNGGKTTLNAGEDVNMGGTFNVVATNANVNAKGDINMTAKNKVGVDISPLLNGHYAELAEEMGMTDVLKNGVSSNIVTGGAKLNAEGDVVMSGVATAIADTTASNVIGAVKGNDLGELMTGGRSTTEVTAGNDIKLVSQMNVVNGGNSTNAGGVVLNAGNDVIMGGDINVVNRAKVNAGNNVDFGGNLNVLKNATVAAQNGAVSFNNTSAEMTNGSISAGAGIFVNNSELVNTVSSDVSIDSVVNLTNSATLANLGSLSLNDAIVVGSTVYIDSANTVVSGALTMQSATLVLTSDTLTLNDTGIDLSFAGDALNVKNVPTVFNDSAVADAVAGVNFIISSDLLDDSMGGDFELILFENATENDYLKMLAAIQVEDVSVTLSDLNRNALLSDDIAVEYVNNNIVIKGSAFIPEPSTATLSLLALAALAARRRRQK